MPKRLRCALFCIFDWTGVPNRIHAPSPEAKVEFGTGVYLNGVTIIANESVRIGDRSVPGACTIFDSDGAGLFLRDVTRTRVGGCVIRAREGIQPGPALRATGGKGNWITQNLLENGYEVPAETARVVVKLRPDQYQAVKRVAAVLGLTGSDVIRWFIDEGTRAVEATPNFNALCVRVQTKDKQGFCHHLANEDRFTWVKKNA